MRIDDFLAPLDPTRRLQLSLLAVAGLVAAGTLGYMVLVDAEPLDALLMTVITVTTVGYGEVVPLSTPSAKLFTVGLIVGAVVITLWAVRGASEMVFERGFWVRLRRRRMQSEIDHMRDHTIVCGFGRMGRAVEAELIAEGIPTVVVERDDSVLSRLEPDGPRAVLGDGTHDETLLRAGVDRARALIAVTDSDATNLMIVLSARELNDSLIIAARAAYPDAANKLRRAGARYVVQPHGTGAMHLALAVTHPVVEEVLNLLIPRLGALDLGQIALQEGDGLQGRTLADIDAHAHGALVLAVHRSGELIVPPHPTQHLMAGDVLVVAGTPGALAWLTRMAGGPQPDVIA